MKHLKVAIADSGFMQMPPPPPVVWPTLDLIYQIGAGLAKRGHEITYYLPKKTRVPEKCRLVSANLDPLRDAWPDAAWATGKITKVNSVLIKTLYDQLLFTPMYRAAAEGKHDFVFIQNPKPALPLARSFGDVTTVYALHSPILPAEAQMFRRFASPNQHFISISDNQRIPAPDLRYAGTIYHGIDTAKIPFNPQTGKFLLFVGRIIPEKGAHLAIQAALKLREKIVVIGPHSDKIAAWKNYWEKDVAPHIGNPLVEYHEYLSPSDLVPYYQNAKALLFPLAWEEAFGLVMIEAMAAGTPVVGFRRGALPEIVVNAKTGFIVDNTDEMFEAIQRVNEIKREDCRAHVINKFSLERMIDDYEQLFSDLSRK